MKRRVDYCLQTFAPRILLYVSARASGENKFHGPLTGPHVFRSFARPIDHPAGPTAPNESPDRRTSLLYL